MECGWLVETIAEKVGRQMLESILLKCLFSEDFSKLLGTFGISMCSKNSTLRGWLGNHFEVVAGADICRLLHLAGILSPAMCSRSGASVS